MPWNVISSQWTGLYKLGRNGFSWHSINIAPMLIKNKDIKIFIGLSSSQLNLGGSTSNFSCSAFIWSDVFDKLVKWLEEVQKGCSIKSLFYFTMWPLGQLEFQWSQPGCIFSRLASSWSTSVFLPCLQSWGFKSGF